MAQGIVVIDQIGQILNPLFGITPRMMSAEDGKLGFTEEDFPGVGRGDMFVVSHPDHFASRAIGDFSSENLQCDLFPDEFGDDDDAEDFFCDDDHLFPDEQAMHDPAYAEAWAQFTAEKGADEFCDGATITLTLHKRASTPVTSASTQKMSPTHCFTRRSERRYQAHGKRGRNRVATIPERVRKHHKALSVLAPTE